VGFDLIVEQDGIVDSSVVKLTDEDHHQASDDVVVMLSAHNTKIYRMVGTMLIEVLKDST
jgi:hypothetical protein